MSDTAYAFGAALARILLSGFARSDVL